jgi:hypothetical protein
MTEQVFGNGITVKNHAIYMMDGEDATKPSIGPISPLDNTNNNSLKPWANWGTNDKLPTEMAIKLEGCGVLSAGVDAKARIAIGKGLQPFLLTDIDQEGKEQLEHVSDPEIHEWIEENDLFEYCFQSMFNEFGYGWASSQIILNGDRNYINRLVATDVHDARLQKRDNVTGTINTLYLSASFDRLSADDPNSVKKVPILKEKFEMEELVKTAKTGRGEFAVLHRKRRNGRQYYPYPLWYAADKWAAVAMQIPDFKKSLHENQMHVKYLVTISQQYFRELYGGNWDTFSPQKRKEAFDEKVDEIDKHLTGTDKAGKTIMSLNFFDKVTGKEIQTIKIEALDDLLKEGKMLPDSSAANAEILFALMINPALIGAGNYGGSSIGNNAGGSNVRESFLTQMMLLEPERKRMSRIMNIISKFNGWSDKLNKDNKRLVWRYPSGLLTTLDTGKSTKSETL